MPKGFDCYVEQFGWDHVVSMLIGDMELSHSSFHQVKHFHEAMNIALKTQKYYFSHRNKAIFIRIVHLDNWIINKCTTSNLLNKLFFHFCHRLTCIVHNFQRMLKLFQRYLKIKTFNYGSDITFI